MTNTNCEKQGLKRLSFAAMGDNLLKKFVLQKIHRDIQNQVKKLKETKTKKKFKATSAKKQYPRQVISKEPPHDKTNKVTCAHSKDPGQPAASCALCAFWVVKDPVLLHANLQTEYARKIRERLQLAYRIANSYQTGRMPRLI